MCGEEKERRVMSPFVSFTPKTFDWVVEVRIPVYEKGIYKTGKIDLCAECYQKMAGNIDKMVERKIKKKKKEVQMSFDLEVKM